jgi:CheY-like chemotaxis protein
MIRARIVSADDHILLLDALKGLLTPQFDVVAIVADGRALVEACARLMPDVIVLDISMLLLNGLDGGRQIRAKFRPTKLMFLTMNPSPQVVAEALRSGRPLTAVPGSPRSRKALAHQSGSGRIRLWKRPSVRIFSRRRRRRGGSCPSYSAPRKRLGMHRSMLQFRMKNLKSSDPRRRTECE